MSRPLLDQLPKLGGLLCLDFVNSIDPRYGDDRVEFLTDYGALVEWAAWAGGIPQEQAGALRRAAGERRDAADAVLARAHGLRDRLHVLLRPHGRDGESAAELHAFNRELRAAARHAELRPSDAGYEPAWHATGAPEEVLWPVVRSAAELMVSPSLERVRECDGHDCGWLFLDTSKAGRRRWCRMDICGNRAKSRRYRGRVRAAA